MHFEHAHGTQLNVQRRNHLPENQPLWAALARKSLPWTAIRAQLHSLSASDASIIKCKRELAHACASSGARGDCVRAASSAASRATQPNGQPTTSQRPSMTGAIQRRNFGWSTQMSPFSLINPMSLKSSVRATVHFAKRPVDLTISEFPWAA